MKTLSKINNGDIFRLNEGSGKMYRKVRQVRITTQSITLLNAPTAAANRAFSLPKTEKYFN